MSDFTTRIIYNPYIGIAPGPQKPSEATEQGKAAGPSDFDQLLQKELTDTSQPVFSKHAQQRVDERAVEVTPELMDKLTDAVSQAKSKGIQDALIISDKASFIVNVPSNMVITTLNNEESKNRIFTNINGTVII